MDHAPAPEFATERLLLRRWRESDREPWAAMSADPAVMKYFQSTLTRAQSELFAERVEERFEQNGFGLWALEVAATGEFIGFTGLNPATFEAPFTPALEIAWRLARPAWGHGYATEAARACLDFAFTTLGREEIVAFTATVNTRSMAVMERLGMVRDPGDDFDHPMVPPWTHSHLVRHVLYRMRSADWTPRG
ncbi:N-acetyltransferase [Actinorhabdospora filicis]|uniref:N-acetyltransferase n=1 Tax=Actinorhabdospora filicis TaxID=1785913 RepID=A0A9W6SMZ4_9ACTN|nr:GNAT family N-acetyltransferase [Actinorhabdospora filicis]GLZ78855.1 N-acetyltransferase [Actinorhabdospora filicis]